MTPDLSETTEVISAEEEGNPPADILFNRLIIRRSEKENREVKLGGSFFVSE